MPRVVKVYTRNGKPVYFEIMHDNGVSVHLNDDAMRRYLSHSDCNDVVVTEDCEIAVSSRVCEVAADHPLGQLEVVHVVTRCGKVEWYDILKPDDTYIHVTPDEIADSLMYGHTFVNAVVGKLGVLIFTERVPEDEIVLSYDRHLIREIKDHNGRRHAICCTSGELKEIRRSGVSEIDDFYDTYDFSDVTYPASHFDTAVRDILSGYDDSCGYRYIDTSVGYTSIGYPIQGRLFVYAKSIDNFVRAYTDSVNFLTDHLNEDMVDSHNVGDIFSKLNPFTGSLCKPQYYPVFNDYVESTSDVFYILGREWVLAVRKFFKAYDAIKIKSDPWL